MPVPAPRFALLICCAFGLLAAAGCASAGRAARPPAAPVAPDLSGPSPLVSPLVVEATAVDRRGSPIDDMRAPDFEVIVEGTRRIGVSVARLYRGPGATNVVALRRATGPGEQPPIAEPDRTVFLVIDQASFLPGDERRARLVAETCLALFGLSERVGVVALPYRDQTVALSVDRDAARQTLGQLRALRVTDAPVDTQANRGEEQPAAQAENRGEQAAVGRGEGAAAGLPARAETIPTLADLMPVAAATDARDTFSPEAAKAHAAATLTGLRELLHALGGLPGGKTVLLVSTGLAASDASAELASAVDAAARAHARIYTVQVPTPAVTFAQMGRRDLEVLARDTGGAFLPLSRRPEESLQRMGAELSSSYLLVLRHAPGDDSARPLRVEVQSRRKGVAIHAARLLVPGRLPTGTAGTGPAVPPAAPSARADAPQPQAPSGAPAPSSGGTPGREEPARVTRDPALEAVLARASEYALAYGRELSAVVSEEVYQQEDRSGSRAPRTRKLVSDFLIVKVPGLQGWLPFRDVFEVDGEPVRDRQDRLVKLFIEAPPAEAIANADTIWKESARYNIGGVYRNVNVPTMALFFLEPENLQRFTFTRRGEETAGGMRMWAVQYRETGRPTIIRTSAGANVPASGLFWIEPVSGRVVRTELLAAGASITVFYGPREESPGLWVPVMMQETYPSGRGSIKATATYSKFRRFQVFTREQITIPKRP